MVRLPELKGPSVMRAVDGFVPCRYLARDNRAMAGASFEGRSPGFSEAKGCEDGKKPGMLTASSDAKP